MEWDVQKVNLAVRERLYEVQDTVDRLMREERELERLCANASRETMLDLAQRAERVKALGGDPSALLAAHDLLQAAYEDHTPKLHAVQNKLAAARANMKWLDMAQSGLHWACFTDPVFARDVLGS